MTHKKLHIIILLLTVIRISVFGDTISDLITDFDRDGYKTETANAFFSQLRRDNIIDEDIVLSSDVPADSVRQMVYYWAGEWYCDKQDYEKSLQYGLKALPLYKGDSEAKAYCLNLLGVVCVRKGDFATGASYTKQCLNLDIASGDNDRISSSLSTLAGTYIAANDPTAAEKYALQGLKYAEKARNTLRKTILMGMLSEIYSKIGEYGKAVEYADQAFKIDSVAGRTGRAAIRLSQKATALADMGDYSQAETTFRRAFPMLIEAGNYHSLAIDYNQMGFMLLKQKRDRQATAYFRKASSLFARMGDLYNQIHSQRGLYESYWDINPDSAHIALEEFNVLKDSLYSQASADALAQYKAEFDTDRLKEEIKQHKQTRKTIFIISGIVLLLVAGVAVIYHRRRISSYRREMQAIIAEIEGIKARMTKNPETDTEPSSAHNRISSDAQSSDLVTKVIDAVIDGLHTGEFSVAHIAARLNMSEQTFRRRFVEASGQAPKAFISAIQMDRAVELLKSNKEMNISEVARECGFEELSAFSRSFKRSFGCTPSQFRADME